MTNVVVLRGRLTRPAALRSLPSGDQLVELEVSIRRDGERAETAPVVWPQAPASALALDVDQDVLVLGRVRRRFFRSGGATQSRTEVVADLVVPASQARRVKGALDQAAARLERGQETAPAVRRPRVAKAG